MVEWWWRRGPTEAVTMRRCSCGGGVGAAVVTPAEGVVQDGTGRRFWGRCAVRLVVVVKVWQSVVVASTPAGEVVQGGTGSECCSVAPVRVVVVV